MDEIGFWNREKERRAIADKTGGGRFGYVTGRRRIGKSALLSLVCRENAGLYHQAVEATPQRQIEHVVSEFGDKLPLFREVVPRSWTEFFALLSREKLPKLIVFDEFPYWAESDPALPSILQKWIDHELPRHDTLMLVSGSSQSMLHAHFLSHDSPLYGRSALHVDLTPLSYAWFCRVFRHSHGDPAAFSRFALVGGVPHYWKLMGGESAAIEAGKLYFESGALLAEEPRHILHDEGVTGQIPKAILDLIGSGVTKPSEVAARLSLPQGHLSRPLALLTDLGLVNRELPYGESTRTSKKVLYTIEDFALAFYYGTYLTHRHRWPTMRAPIKSRLIEEHVSRRWESYCRSVHPGSGRHWDKNSEIDIVAPLDNPKSCLVAECKWRTIDTKERKHLKLDLEKKFRNSALAIRYPDAVFDVYAQNDLERVARMAG